MSDPPTHATIRGTDSGSGQLRGRGDHPGLSADGPSATIGSDERCSTDLATEPTTAPRRRPRPCVDRQTTHEPNASLRRAITSAGSPSATTNARSSSASTPSVAAARARRRAAFSSAPATLTVCSSAPKRSATTRAVGIAWSANSDPSSGTSTCLTCGSGGVVSASVVTAPALPTATTRGPVGPSTTRTVFLYAYAR